MNEQTTPGRLLLSPREAAAKLSMSQRTLWTLTASGEIPRVKIGRLVRYDPRDLRRWIEATKQTSQKPAGQKSPAG